jgi:hypothetical protein
MEGKGLALTETVDLTTSAAAVGVDDALAGAGDGTLFATELGGFEEAEAPAAVGCAGCGWTTLLADETLDVGDGLG